MALENGRIHVVGLGGTLRENSTSLVALERSLRSAEAAGASTELLSLYELDLPMFVPDKPLDTYGPSVHTLIDAARRADAMIWSTAAYHGTLAAPTKNALDFLEFLKTDARPYLHERVIGLIAVAGGDIAAVNSVNAMVHIVHSLRGSVAPLLVPISAATSVFDAEGNVVDAKWAGRLDQLGRLVVETAERWQPREIEVSVGA